MRARIQDRLKQLVKDESIAKAGRIAEQALQTQLAGVESDLPTVERNLARADSLDVLQAITKEYKKLLEQQSKFAHKLLPLHRHPRDALVWNKSWKLHSVLWTESKS